MPEEVVAATTTPDPTTATAAGAQGTAAAETVITSGSAQAAEGAGTAAAAGADWSSMIDSADPEQLRRHPRIAGIVGDLLSKQKEADRKRWEDEAAEKARGEERSRLKQLRQSDPVGYAELMEAREAEQESREAMAKLHRETESQLGKLLGESFRELPEWAELTPEEFDSLARAVAEKPERGVGAFAQAATRTVAGKIAAKMLADWKAKELGKEREAIRQEEAAKLLKREKSPDMTKPAGAPAKPSLAAIPDDAEFNRRYEEELHKRTLSRYR